PNGVIRNTDGTGRLVATYNPQTGIILAADYVNGQCAHIFELDVLRGMKTTWTPDANDVWHNDRNQEARGKLEFNADGELLWAQGDEGGHQTGEQFPQTVLPQSELPQIPEGGLPPGFLPGSQNRLPQSGLLPGGMMRRAYPPGGSFLPQQRR